MPKKIAKKKAKGTLSDQDVSNIAAAVGSILFRYIPSNRELREKIQREWPGSRPKPRKRGEDKVFGEGVGFKKGGPAKKRAVYVKQGTNK